MNLREANAAIQDRHTKLQDDITALVKAFYAETNIIVTDIFITDHGKYKSSKVIVVTDAGSLPGQRDPSEWGL